MLAWIGATTTYPVPAAPRGVRFVAPDGIGDAMCDGQECAVGAMYARGRDVVDVEQQLDPAANVFDAAVLVHWVQDTSGRFPGRDGLTWVAEEREAYALQAAWLRARHRRYPLARQLPDASLCDQSALDRHR